MFVGCVRFGDVVVGFMGDPAEVAEACSEHTDAFFQSVEGDAPDAGGEG